MRWRGARVSNQKAKQNVALMRLQVKVNYKLTSICLPYNAAPQQRLYRMKYAPHHHISYTGFYRRVLIVERKVSSVGGVKKARAWMVGASNRPTTKQ